MKETVSIDLFTVPTATFKIFYVFLVLSQERRKIVHFNVTDSPTAAWTGRQITQAFPWTGIRSHEPPRSPRNTCPKLQDAISYPPGMSHKGPREGRSS